MLPHPSGEVLASSQALGALEKGMTLIGAPQTPDISPQAPLATRGLWVRALTPQGGFQVPEAKRTGEQGRAPIANHTKPDQNPQRGVAQRRAK